MWQSVGMHAFRSLFALLLVLVLLPWGAYSAQMPGAANPPSRAIALAATTETAALGAQTQDDVRLVSPKHCRGPVLPGSACNPVPGLLPETAAIAGIRDVVHLRAAADLAATGRDLSPPLAPPRSC